MIQKLQNNLLIINQKKCQKNKDTGIKSNTILIFNFLKKMQTIQRDKDYSKEWVKLWVLEHQVNVGKSKLYKITSLKIQSTKNKINTRNGFLEIQTTSTYVFCQTQNPGYRLGLILNLWIGVLKDLFYKIVSL